MTWPEALFYSVCALSAALVMCVWHTDRWPWEPSVYEDDSDEKDEDE